MRLACSGSLTATGLGFLFFPIIAAHAQRGPVAIIGRITNKAETKWVKRCLGEQ
jgi:hypothetical protein